MQAAPPGLEFVTCILRNIGHSIETGRFQGGGSIFHAIGTFEATTAEEDKFDLRLVFKVVGGV